MATLDLLLLVFALVCEILAAVGVGHPRVNMMAAGLAFWIASIIL